MKIVKPLWLPFVILLSSGVLFTLFVPYLPIDETRYLSVAWEMKLHHSFIVPLLNNLPYSDKPPFLFWLINLDWLIFGVNEKTLRFIPLVFSFLNMVMVYKISLIMWKDKKIAEYAAIILSSTLIYLVWSPLIMFDIVLTFWVLMGISGLLQLSRNKNNTINIRSWMLIGISTCGGLLTKGPVIFVYLLPLSILAFWWIPEEKFTIKWYLSVILSFFTGIIMILPWLIPALIKGGESYREAILWGQTIHRVVSSFAHQRPIWWYIPFIPILFFPWILLKPAWCEYSEIKNDYNARFLVISIVTALIIFSLISGKQIHYLIPLLPAASMLMAKNIVRNCINGKFNEHSRHWHYLLAVFYIILGLMILFLPVINGNILKNISVKTAIVLSCGPVIMGSIMLFIKPESIDRFIQFISLSSLAFIISVVAGGNIFFKRYDMHGIAHILKEKQDDGYEIIHYGKYAGQYQFTGRLTQPVLVLKTKNAIKNYAKNHDKLVLISYEKQKKIINDGNDMIFQQPYMNKKVVLWNENKITHF